MQVVILCGGFGTRLGEATETRPKPMIEIGDYPIVWHIMKSYYHFNFSDFILCLGYKGQMIKDYFLNYSHINNDLKLDLSSGSVNIVNTNTPLNWEITLANTGLNSMTGSRVKQIEHYVEGPEFMLKYGDGVTDLNIQELVNFHRSHGKIGTVTAVSPSSQYGELEINNNQVVSFQEKPDSNSSFISGGYFVFNREFFDYLSTDENCVLEKEPLANLAKDGELMVYTHNGFWQCMDTPRDVSYLRNLWQNNPAWKR